MNEWIQNAPAPFMPHMGKWMCVHARTRMLYNVYIMHAIISPWSLSHEVHQCRTQCLLQWHLINLNICLSGRQWDIISKPISTENFGKYIKSRIILPRKAYGHEVNHKQIRNSISILYRDHRDYSSAVWWFSTGWMVWCGVIYRKSHFVLDDHKNKRL